MQNFYKKLTLNTIYQVVGKGLNVLMALFTLGILSRYLGVKGMGEYATILRYLGFFGIIADLGLNILTAREISKINLRDKTNLLMNFFTLRVVTSVVIMSVGLGGIFLLPYDANIKQGVFVATSAFLFILWTQIFNGVFQKHWVTQKSILADFLAKSVTLGLTFFLVLQKANLMLILWALVAGNALGFILTLWFVQAYYKLSLRFDWLIWKEILISAWPVAVSNFLILIYFNIDALMLASLRPMEEAGVYHVAYKVLETFFQFMVLFIGLFVPVLARSLLQKIQFKQNLQTAFNGVLIIGMPLMFAGLFLAKDIVLIVGGKTFMAAVPVLQVLFLAMFFLFINHLMHNVLTVLELQKKVIPLYVCVAVFNILANLYAINKWGASGAAYTTLLSEFMIAILIYFFFLKQKQFYPSVHYGFKLLWMSLIMLVGLFFVREMPWFIKIIVGGSIYVFLFYLFLPKEKLDKI